MRYYKLIENNNTFLGVITENNFRKYQKKHNILLVCDSASAEYARFEDKIYRDHSWMKLIDKDNNIEYIDIDIINISEEEYNTLLKAIKTNEEIKIISEEESEIIEEFDMTEEESEEDTDVTVDYVKKTKILEMSKVCKNVIIRGCDISLSDGNEYHFSFSLEDQINLLNILNLVNSSNDKIIYHADGERCRYFSKEDIMLIINNLNSFKTYHTTYFNGLKAYIQSLNSIDEVAKIEYGIELPDKFTHVFLKQYKETNR